MKIKPFIPISEQVCRLGKNEWSVARLHALAKDLPVMDVPIDHLNICNYYNNLTLREMAMHMKSVNDADLSYPIILDEDGDIMDGRHRIIKTILLGLPTIKAVRFENNPDPCRVNEAKP